MANSHARASDPLAMRFQLDEHSSVPARWQNPPAFTITRLESPIGIPDRIVKVSSVPALLVSISLRPIAGAAIGSKYTAAPLNASLAPDSAGFLYIDRAKFHENFCADVPPAEARIMAVSQKPLAGSAFGASVPVAAWKTIPTWYIVSKNDRAINPDVERFYAKRANAKTTEIASSHVPFLSHPKEVAKVIEDAAK